MTYLRQVFELYSRVLVITLYGDSSEFDTPEGVMAYWESRNVELSSRDILPEGMLHFDIIARHRVTAA